jgi:membrane associated rhomboid family serine protease
MSILRSTWGDARYAFQNGTMTTKLLVVNAVVFVLMLLLWIGIGMYYPSAEKAAAIAHYKKIYQIFAIPSDPGLLLRQPWSLFTSMFLHVDFWGHLLGNLMFLALFGRIIMDMVGEKRVLTIYILGGLVGNFFFILQSNLMYPGLNHYALGASAGVMALAGAAVAAQPNYPLYFAFFGRVLLKYLVGILVLMDLAGIARDINTGGHFAHLGGLFLGWFFIWRLERSHDLSDPLNRLIERAKAWFRFRSNKTSPYKRPGQKTVRVSMTQSSGPQNVRDDSSPPDREATLNAILDKIKAQGFESLTAEEKEFLFDASKR